MKEVKPERLPTPEIEPILRVGIVLEEDALTSLTLTLAGESHRCEQLPDRLDGRYLVQFVTKQELLLSDHSGAELFRGKTLRFIQEQPAQLRGQTGLKVTPVIAGRQFHWRKETEQSFPGTLEIHARENGLVAVNEVRFEDYLACVVSSEMSSDCPSEFIKAQAVAARSWALVFLRNKHSHPLFTICNDDDCQRYQGTTFLNEQSLQAVRACAGEFLVSDREAVIPTYYSKSCGGQTEAAVNIFGVQAESSFSVPDTFLRLDLDLRDDQGFAEFLEAPDSRFAAACGSTGVTTEDLARYLGAVDERQEYYRWEYTLSIEQLERNLREKFGLEEKKLEKILSLKPGKRGMSGRYLSFEISYKGARGEEILLLENQYQIRQAFHESFLFSSAFLHQEVRDSTGNLIEIRFRGTGWGHGVGLCQIGALARARKGANHREILAHYFPESRLKKSYE